MRKIVKYSAIYAGLLLSILFVSVGHSQQEDFPVLKGPYLGQTPPGIEPEIFAPGLISTYYSQSYIAFLDEARVCVYSASTEKGHETYYTYEKNGHWTTPQRASFEELQGHPNYTTGPLGRKVYFHSGRPTHPDDTRQDDNIWTIEWTGSDWAEPEALPTPANSDYGEAYPSATADGTVYFFTWRRPGTRGDDIWVSRCIDGQYQEAERLPWPINTDFIEYDPYIAPDESFLVFGSSRPGGYGSSDNYICFRKKDGSWTHPINLGRPLNSSSYDLCANGTPDGKYFFFLSGRKTDVDKGNIGKKSGEEPEEDSDLYWVDFSFINELKNTVLAKQNAAEIIKEDYKEKGIQSAIDTLNKLYSNQKADTNFSPFELLSLCKNMIAEDKTGDADLFFSTLDKMLSKDFSIKEGYARFCAMNGRVLKGLNILEELESEDPNFDLSDSLSGLGYLFTLYTDKTEDALSVLQFTVEKFPEDPFAYYSLARVYRQLGELDNAIANCRKALEIRPSIGDVSQLLERLLKEQESFPVLKGPYLGQEPPGKTPEIFAPGIISTGHDERIAAFTPDGKEFYYVLYGAPHMIILFTKEENGRWTKPRVTPFSDKYGSEFNISPDGNKIVFASFQPLNNQGAESEIGHTWIVERSASGWSEPKPLRPELFGYPSLSLAGHLYFNPRREDGMGGEDIYISKLIDGEYAEPENLGEQVNSEMDEVDPFIAPDESYIIFLRRDKEGFGGFDLFISFRKRDGSWTKAKNMGEPINSSASELCPSISPDGKYFFFTSYRSIHKPYSDVPLTYEEKIKILKSPGNGLGDIYWVDARVIEDLKPKELK